METGKEVQNLDGGSEYDFQHCAWISQELHNLNNASVANVIQTVAIEGSDT